MSNKISLEEFAQKQYPILLDTSALIILDKSKIPTNIEKQFPIIEAYYNSLLLMKKYIKKGSNFYITPLVSKEFQAKNYNCCKLLRSYRKINNYEEEKDLINVFQDNNKILQFQGIKKNLYDILCERYINLGRGYGLSDANFESLISAITLAKKRISVALVSNDKGIFNARIDILTREHLWSGKVEFFTRNNSYFERIKEFRYI